MDKHPEPFPDDEIIAGLNRVQGRGYQFIESVYGHPGVEHWTWPEQDKPRRDDLRLTPLQPKPGP